MNAGELDKGAALRGGKFGGRNAPAGRQEPNEGTHQRVVDGHGRREKSALPWLWNMRGAKPHPSPNRCLIADRLQAADIASNPPQVALAPRRGAGQLQHQMHCVEPRVKREHPRDDRAPPIGESAKESVLAGLATSANGHPPAETPRRRMAGLRHRYVALVAIGTTIAADVLTWTCSAKVWLQYSRPSAGRPPRGTNAPSS